MVICSFLSLTTRAYDQSTRIKLFQYIEDWRAKVERIGEQNYPDAARGKMYGNLRISVTIKKDGSLKEIVILRRSKYPILDEAAVKIIRLGEPYAPFPPEIAQDIDEIEFART